jgi:D-serine deaminase-like pyridoxal phosphate-dependent protein
MMGTDLVGRPKIELDTPVLLVDLDVMEANIARMADFFRRAGVRWRPHVKGVKAPAIAHKEIAAGAIGVTCAKLAEAEVMAAAGIRNILIANQVVGARKAVRVVNLLAQANVIVAVDSLVNAEELSDAAQRKGVRLPVLVEVNIGMNRAGVEPGDPVVTLAQKVAKLPGLQFAGLTGYEGNCAPIRDAEEKKRACEHSVGLILDSAERCRKNGLPIEIISCSGTVTSPFTVHLPGVTEVQSGGGIFSDLLYESYGVQHPFALTVLSTVTSRPTPHRIVVDAGRKAMSVDMLPPRPKNIVEPIDSVRVSAEHARIELREPNETLRVGDLLEWIVGYADTTVCLHDEIVAIRGDAVEAVWPILARGKMT